MSLHADNLLATPCPINKKIASKTVFQYFLAAILSLLIFSLVTHAWSLKLSIPFFYSWDSVFTGTLIKSVIDAGWFTVNPYIGAPNGYNLADFPMNPDNFHFLIIKLLSYVTHNYAIILNIFYILTFPTATVSALFVLKRLGLRYPFALAASLLFALSPYHFFRGEIGHLFLASYYVVPLAVWLSVLIATNQLASISQHKKYIAWGVYLLLCALIGSSGIYYAFFSLFFILSSGVITSINYKKMTPFLQAMGLCFLISATLVVNLAPSIAYRLHYGSNKEVAARAPFESELYGLKVIQMLLPLDNDRLPIMSKYANRYNSSAPIVNKENGIAALGIIGSVGFLVLLGMMILGTQVSKEINILSKLNLCGLLLATIGGFGSLFAYTISPMIRCYNRISIFIAFFSLYAFFFFMQKLMKKYPIFQLTTLTWLFLTLVVTIGIFNQTEKSFAGLQGASILSDYKNDSEFVKDIEKTMDRGNLIYQLPYTNFPEQAPIFSMADYEQFRAYLHSHYLKWSYGAIKGRPTAMWQNNASILPALQMIKNLGYAGYSGIYIDRNGYSDHGIAIEEQISKIINKPPLISKNNNLSFFDIRAYVNNQKKLASGALWSKQATQTTDQLKLSFSWGKGFYESEELGQNQWRWSKQKGVLNIVNYNDKPIRVKIDFTAITNSPNLSTLILNGSLVNTQLKTNNSGIVFSKEFDILPGTNKLYFSSDAQQVIALGDPRQLYFRIQNFSSTVY